MKWLIYNRALTTNEVQAIYNAGSTGKCHQAPTIVVQPAGLAVTEGSSATFTVTADGTPPLGYQWRQGGTNLAGATGSALMLANVQFANASSYSVLVTNAFGSMLSSDATLTVVQVQRAEIKFVVPAGSASSTVRLEIRGAPNRVYVIEASTNLMDWVTIGLGATDTGGNVKFTDPNEANPPVQFYRAVEQ